MINLALATLIIVAYTIFVVCKFGIPRSLSDTYYLLNKNGWLFQLVLVVFAFLVIPIWLDCSSENTEFLAFLSCSGIWFVAAAAAFKIDLTGVVHYVSAVLCCVCAVVWQLFEFSPFIPFFFLGIACLGGY